MIFFYWDAIYHTYQLGISLMVAGGFTVRVDANGHGGK
ncbi:hypothetical protein KGM_213857 [Danaus plexippus plexippus]|uniref:Uncharacterized protein n=1 Tax=Danaus plexippus plexippus TaxID=278856 RepID=A0A212ELA6_DANPL|nr:hypothetical protein KGM_213857 [Danaus plexippus plexippus]